MTVSLESRLRGIIRQTGPLTIAQYMAHCLTDPTAGYYRVRTPLGSTGDFITAPEVSQMFGELVGVWCQFVHQDGQSPAAINLVELGPGRGTLMADLMRTVSPGSAFADGVSVHLVEVSEALQAVQQENLAHVSPTWHRDPASVPPGFTIVVANEFFDALPVHQFLHHEGTWWERMVGLDDQDALEFQRGSAVATSLIPRDRRHAGNGAIVETRPAASAILAQLGAHIDRHGGALLMIDYGYGHDGAVGDTLQAVRAHAYVDVLSEPGTADLTAHVDFATLATEAKSQGLTVHGPINQGDFLLNMGILERAGQLGADGSDALQQDIQQAVDRLVSPTEMGNLFKVIAVSPAGTTVPGFDRPDAMPTHRKGRFPLP